MDKAPDAFRTISEVAEDLDVPQHVLRFWESRFPQIKPMKRGGGRRYYRPDDVDLLRGIRHLLYGEGYTIRGVQRILREQGGRFVQSVWREGAPQPERHAADEAEPEMTAAGAAGGDEPDGEAAAVDTRQEPALPGPPSTGRPAAAAVSPVPPMPPPGPVLTAEDLRQLRTTLDALRECKRRLDEALVEGG